MTPLLIWSEAYSVGHPALDDEHRLILETINTICELWNETRSQQIRAALNELKHVTDGHFRHENDILREIAANAAATRRSADFLKAMSQAVIAEHIAGHGHAFDVLESMIRIANSDAMPLKKNLHDALPHWFVNHAVKHDAHLKALFQAMANDCPDLLRRLS